MIDTDTLDPGLLLMDGFDDCIIGVCDRFGQDPIVAYNHSLVIDKLIDEGMSHTEAVEWFEYNMLGAWLGPKTPCFVYAVETAD